MGLFQEVIFFFHGHVNPVVLGLTWGCLVSSHCPRRYLSWILRHVKLRPVRLVNSWNVGYMSGSWRTHRHWERYSLILICLLWRFRLQESKFFGAV